MEYEPPEEYLSFTLSDGSIFDAKDFSFNSNGFFLDDLKIGFGESGVMYMRTDEMGIEHNEACRRYLYQSTKISKTLRKLVETVLKIAQPVDEFEITIGMDSKRNIECQISVKLVFKIIGIDASRIECYANALYSDFKLKNEIEFRIDAYKMEGSRESLLFYRRGINGDEFVKSLKKMTFWL